MAADTGRVEAVQLLLGHKADVNATNQVLACCIHLDSRLAVQSFHIRGCVFGCSLSLTSKERTLYSSYCAAVADAASVRKGPCCVRLT